MSDKASCAQREKSQVVPFTKALKLALLVVSLSCGAAGAIDTQGWKPSNAEVLSLPQFCYGQFLGDKYSAPQFNISLDCGYGMNHYCPGLVVLNRANKSYADRANRRAYLEAANRDMVYTLKNMEKYPSCPIRSHVENTRRLIETQLRTLR